jgi:hypothetical protein
LKSWLETALRFPPVSVRSPVYGTAEIVAMTNTKEIVRLNLFLTDSRIYLIKEETDRWTFMNLWIDGQMAKHMNRQMERKTEEKT